MCAEKKPGTKGPAIEATSAPSAVSLELSGEAASQISTDEPFEYSAHMKRVLALCGPSETSSASAPSSQPSSRSPLVESCLAAALFTDPSLAQLVSQASELIQTADERAEQHVRAVCRAPAPAPPSDVAASSSSMASVDTPTATPEPDVPPIDGTRSAAARPPPERPATARADRQAPSSKKAFIQVKSKKPF